METLNLKAKILELNRMSNTYKMIIPDNVERKIRYICQKIQKDEWSGTLFYKPEGSFEDNSLVIKCVDIYLMDIGSAAYTEFDMSPDVISYMTENPELLDCQLGLIHSHNQMATFFSSTDTATLREEGTDRNHFVSLIVNNEGTYTAAITRRVKSQKTIEDNSTYPTFNDEEISSSEKYISESEEIEWFYLKIEFEVDNSNSDLSNRLIELKKAKEDKIKKSKKFNSILPQNSTPVQGTLFKDNKKNTIIHSNPSVSFWDRSEEEEVNIEKADIAFNKHLNPTLLKSLLLQLLTGCIVVAKDSKINPISWASKMTDVFDKRFGSDANGFSLFEIWAENFVDFICVYTEDSSLSNDPNIDDDVLAFICAKDLILELEKLPKNKYIIAYMDILNRYLL